MGNQQSFEKHIDFKDLKSNYTYEKKYSDSRFGEVKLLKENSTGQRVFQKDFSSTTAKEFESYMQDIKNTTALSHPNVLKVYGYNSKKEDLFCADFYKLSLFFESFEKDLEQDISKRQKTKDYYPETELWYILDSIASACAYLQNNKIPHRDIRPYNVFVTPSKEYKLSPNSLFKPSYNPGYFSNLEGLEEQSIYYSPEQLQFFAKSEGQRANITYDEYKSDVFGLGMTMLEAGLLERVPDIYNHEKHEVREVPIKEGLNQLRSRYSENFVRTVESAILFNPDERLDFIRLDRELGAYRRDIREKARGIQPERDVVSDPDELDKRVRAAVKRSEDIIRRSSPTKSRNKDLDPIIEAYLNSDPKSSLNRANVTPFLTSGSRYEPTLNVEQNYTYTQNQSEVVKRAGYVDQSGTTPRQGGTGTTPRQGLATSGVGAASFGGQSGQAGLASSQVGAGTPGAQAGVKTSQVGTGGYGATAGISSSQVGAGYGATTGQAGLSGSQVGGGYGAQQTGVSGSQVGGGYGAQQTGVSGSQVGATYGATGSYGAGATGYGTTATGQAGLSSSQVGAGYGAQQTGVSGSQVGTGYGAQQTGVSGSQVGTGGYGATTGQAGLSSSQVGAGYGATAGVSGSQVGTGGYGATTGQGGLSSSQVGAGYGATTGQTGLSSSQVGATSYGATTGYGAPTAGVKTSQVGTTGQTGLSGSQVGATAGQTGLSGSQVGGTTGGFGSYSYGNYGTTNYGTQGTTGLEGVKKSYTEGEAGLQALGGNTGTYSSTTGNYGVGGTYTTTTYTTSYQTSSKEGNVDSDDLEKRIREALAQSKQTSY